MKKSYIGKLYRDKKLMWWRLRSCDGDTAINNILRGYDLSEAYENKIIKISIEVDEVKCPNL